ncbi:MAG: serine hydrolase [Desulfobacteraceae bacterium]|nr:MAG: serine hydrolase [Desulfobacteraceae bacterium]
MEKLAGELNRMCDRQPFQTGWYLKNLRTGEACDRNGDVVVPSASTRKVSILMALLKEVNEGRFRLDQPVVIEEKYQKNNSGTFQHLTPGFTVTLQDAAYMMIIVSDNTCTGTIIDMVGLDAVNRLCRSVGMKGTFHRDTIPPFCAGFVPDFIRAKGEVPVVGRDHSLEEVTTTTPADQGLLLDLILKGTEDRDAAARLGCTPELCRLGIEILSRQKLSWRLPALLPYGTKVAHKTGTGRAGRNNNDVGIIFQGSRPLFILTVYTEHVPLEMPDGMPGYTIAGHHIARLCRTCWDSIRE